MKFREKRPVTLDLDHMKLLHSEAAEQLELMQTALQAAQVTTGTMRDALDQIAVNHWHSYLDILHMISLHDESFAAILQKANLIFRQDETRDEPEENLGDFREPLSLLLLSLIRRHRRFDRVYAFRNNPMGDYLKESLKTERQHVAELIEMVQTLL
ncbi:MAG: hypothetical protein E6713_15590 [Sporomusaceae bacterium]|nr:hypothetical protein [Sporomusaceae bacterium]